MKATSKGSAGQTAKIAKIRSEQQPINRENSKGEAMIHPLSASVMTAYQGPLPPASEFAKYEQVVPGSADRIIKMAEKSMDADIELERRKYKLVGISMLADKGLGYLLLILAFILLVFDKPGYAFIVALAPIISYIVGIPTQRNSEIDKHDNKRQ